jgi:membrane-associated phospholipid phosphatase
MMLPRRAARDRGMVHTMRVLAPIIAASVVVALAARADAEPGAWERRSRHLAVLAVASGVYITSETLLKAELSPDACRWCEPTSLDTKVRNALVWADPARAVTASNLTGYVAAPIFAFGLLALSGAKDPDRFGRFVDDAIPVAETLVFTELFTNAVKYSVARQRPAIHFAETPPAPGYEDNLSFFSGHSSLTFSIAVSAGMVAHRRHTPWEPIIWGGGLALAATTAYLRIAGDRHYISDVLVGTSVGVAGGLVIPRLVGSLPAEPSVVATGNGVALIGRF